MLQALGIHRLSVLLTVLVIITTRVSAVGPYGVNHILSDSYFDCTVVYIPDEATVHANMRNSTFMQLLYDNMTYIDNDVFIHQGVMVFSEFVGSEMHTLEPLVPLSERHYPRLENSTWRHGEHSYTYKEEEENTSFDNDTMAFKKRSAILTLATFYSEGQVSWYRSDTLSRASFTNFTSTCHISSIAFESWFSTLCQTWTDEDCSVPWNCAL
ncbi:hypothetical protein V1520DRAFT_335565 [Lipomyces starkeyi]|uniref:Uncharacterized protein n=1 Tax=Lipomyces starkeyi NRRL Y-11557 TaxID=675824 RepID=A0A1E3PVG9_LIPST|nr:hypothetical protein LIPSTDRAFT_195252 [Lipomyces starkeyi NRRL Y-11557]